MPPHSPLRRHTTEDEVILPEKQHAASLQQAHLRVSHSGGAGAGTDLCKGQTSFGVDWVGQLGLKQFKSRGTVLITEFEIISYWLGSGDHANTV